MLGQGTASCREHSAPKGKQLCSCDAHRLFAGSSKLSRRLHPPAGTPLQNFTSYSNVLFGDEQGGDVLAGEPAAAKQQAEAETPRSMSVADKVQQQIALNQQKRLARLQVRPPAGFLGFAR